MLDRKERCTAERDSHGAMDASHFSLIEMVKEESRRRISSSGSGLHNLFQRWPVADDQSRSLKLQQLFFLEL
jgi:hypothetical protein